MNVEVINIAQDREVLLGFLRPTYTILDNVSGTNKFITHRDIKSKIERDALDVYYNDCVFISKQIFDEVWDDERITQEVIKFARSNFKSRKTKLETTKETFVQDCINFIFGLSVEDDESDILQLFDSYGSMAFIRNYVKFTSKLPYQQVVAAVNTFLMKISKDASSIYYKKKGMQFDDLINSNREKAFENYVVRDKDGLGLSELKLFLDLIEK